MASRLVQEKRAPAVMIELLEKATRSLRTASSRPPILVMQLVRATLRREIRQAHWVEPVVPCLADEKQQVRATLRRALFVLAV